MDISKIKKEDWIRLGGWTNGTYFNALSFESETSSLYKELFGFEIPSASFINVDDVTFCEKRHATQLASIVAKDVPWFVSQWNVSCEKSVLLLRNIVDGMKEKDFQAFSDSELLERLGELQNRMRRVLLFLWSWVAVVETIEEYVVDTFPKLDFSGIRPLKYLSSELLNIDLLAAESNEQINQVLERWKWHGINLLRSTPLSFEDMKKLRKLAKRPPRLVESENSFLRSIQLFSWLKFERIDCMNYALYYSSELYFEILRRLSISEKYREVIIPSELSFNFKKSFNELDSRFKFRGVVGDKGVVRHVVPSEFKKLKKELLTSESKTSRFLKGKSACSGFVQGKVKVMHSPDEIVKIKPGDILVAHETLVQHEPVLRTVKGMIVEMGSLLCHSAIFAREFSIPTVIGVRDATKFFCDGDEVEVDANKGLIRRID